MQEVDLQRKHLFAIYANTTTVLLSSGCLHFLLDQTLYFTLSHETAAIQFEIYLLTTV